MSSLFDTLVRNRRNHTKWARMSARAFMEEMVWNGAAKKIGDQAVPVSVSVVYRPDVASRMWFTVTWPSENGDVLEASAQELELALWRAAEMEASRQKHAPDEPPPPLDPPVLGPSGPEGTVGP